MNIDLLSKMIKEQILEVDSVIIPHLGTFIAEYIPATFSDRGYTINPPYRRLIFRQIEEGEVNIVDVYAKSNDISIKQAELILKDYIKELRIILETKKTITFPELGKLRATKENNFFFVLFEDVDIYPEGFGLEAISLKSNKQDIEDFQDTISEIKDILSDNDTNLSPLEQKKVEDGLDNIDKEKVEEKSDSIDNKEVVSEKLEKIERDVESEEGLEKIEKDLESEEELEKSEKDVESEERLEKSEKDVESEEGLEKIEKDLESEERLEKIEKEEKQNENKERGKYNKAFIISLLLIFFIFILSIAILLFLNKYYPDIIDKLLYTKEQLEIINYKL